MELKLTVSVGASLQIKNAKGEWDWIKPEVGAEVVLDGNDPQETFSYLWDEVVGPQFKTVVESLTTQQVQSSHESVDSNTTQGTVEELDEY